MIQEISFLFENSPPSIEKLKKAVKVILLEVDMQWNPLLFWHFGTYHFLYLKDVHNLESQKIFYHLATISSRK